MSSRTLVLRERRPFATSMHSCLCGGDDGGVSPARLRVGRVVVVGSGVEGLWRRARTLPYSGAKAVSGGAASGAVASGNMRGAVNGALSGMLFCGIGRYYQSQNSAWAHAGGKTNVPLITAGWTSRGVAYGTAGGIMSELEGD